MFVLVFEFASKHFFTKGKTSHARIKCLTFWEFILLHFHMSIIVCILYLYASYIHKYISFLMYKISMYVHYTYICIPGDLMLTQGVQFKTHLNSRNYDNKSVENCPLSNTILWYEWLKHDSLLSKVKIRYSDTHI